MASQQSIDIEALEPTSLTGGSFSRGAVHSPRENVAGRNSRLGVAGLCDPEETDTSEEKGVEKKVDSMEEQTSGIKSEGRKGVLGKLKKAFSKRSQS